MNENAPAGRSPGRPEPARVDSRDRAMYPTDEGLT